MAAFLEFFDFTKFWTSMTQNYDLQASFVLNTETAQTAMLSLVCFFTCHYTIFDSKG